ncbi:MAG: prepilin-type N-terminal cleavage/methylation domain-containing protein [bacterium]
MLRNREGFTLIELLIVMAVIAILIGIALPRFRGMQDESNLARARSELRTLQTGVESYYINSSPKTYPAYDGGSTVWQVALTGATPQIISSVLYDPFGATATTQYRYDASPNRSYYIIWSRGAGRENQVLTISNAGAIGGTVGTKIYVTNQ